MVNVSNLIDKYIREHIALSKKDIQQSVKSRKWVLDKIVSKIEEKSGQPILLKDKPYFVYGSYIKGTKVSDVDEFDVMLVIDANNGMFSIAGNKVGDGIGYASPNPKYSGNYHKEDNSGVSPRRILFWLKSIVKEALTAYGVEEPFIDGNSIVVNIKSSDVKMDLVPGSLFKHASIYGKEFYNIPDGKAEDGWILTNPTYDIKLLNDYTENRNDFKNVIRLLKHIRENYNMGSNIKSFAVECALINYVTSNTWFNTLSIDFKNSLKHFSASLRSKNITDSYDNGNNLLSDTSQDTCNWYADRIGALSEELTKIESYNDETQAYERLMKLFQNNL